MLPNLNRLLAFHRVYELGSIRDAAQSLGVTQSALSQQLSKLEEELGAQLFVRRHRQLVAASSSHALARRVGEFLQELEGELAAIHLGKEVPAGKLRIGAPRELGARRLPELVAAFRRRYPAVCFEVTLGGPDQVLPMLENGGLDLAFCDVFEPQRSRHASSALAFQPLFDEELILVVSARHARRAFQGDLSCKRLLEAEFVCYTEKAEAVRHWFRYHYRRVPSPLRIVLSVQSVPAVVRAVGEGVGLGVVPAEAVARELGAGRLLEVTTPRKRIASRISLVQLQDKRPGAAERHFVRALASAFG